MQVERLLVFPSLSLPLCPPPPPLTYTFHVMGACLVPVCQVLPAIGAVSILELAANSGSSRMSQALHLATQLLNEVKCNLTYMQLTTGAITCQLCFPVLAEQHNCGCVPKTNIDLFAVSTFGHCFIPSLPLFALCDGYKCTGIWLLFCREAHGWVAKISQPWKQSPSRSRLSIE